MRFGRLISDDTLDNAHVEHAGRLVDGFTDIGGPTSQVS